MTVRRVSFLLLLATIAIFALSPNAQFAARDVTRQFIDFVNRDEIAALKANVKNQLREEDYEAATETLRAALHKDPWNRDALKLLWVLCGLAPDRCPAASKAASVQPPLPNCPKAFDAFMEYDAARKAGRTIGLPDGQIWSPKPAESVAEIWMSATGAIVGASLTFFNEPNAQTAAFLVALFEVETCSRDAYRSSSSFSEKAFEAVQKHYSPRMRDIFSAYANSSAEAVFAY